MVNYYNLPIKLCDSDVLYLILKPFYFKIIIELQVVQR